MRISRSMPEETTVNATIALDGAPTGGNRPANELARFDLATLGPIPVDYTDEIPNAQ